jgi:hypothetical protein
VDDLELLKWKSRVLYFANDGEFEDESEYQYGETEEEYYCHYASNRASLSKKEEAWIEKAELELWCVYQIQVDETKKRWFFILKDESDITFLTIDYKDLSEIIKVGYYSDIREIECSKSEFISFGEKHEKLVNWIYQEFIDKAKNRLDYAFK